MSKVEKSVKRSTFIYRKIPRISPGGQLYEGLIFGRAYCETHEAVNTRNIMECYCVARNKPVRHEITKLQTATVKITVAVSLCRYFWGLLVYLERYCDWPVHNQHSWKFSGVHGFLSLKVTSWGAYVGREICISKLIALPCSGKEIYHFLLCFPLYLRANSKYKTPRGLYVEGRFNGGFFCFSIWGGLFLFYSFYFILHLPHTINIAERKWNIYI